MTTSYSTSNVFNQCATCDFWGGARILVNGYFRKVVKVDNDVEGECLEADSVFSHHQQPADSGCSKWSKWRALA